MKRALHFVLIFAGLALGAFQLAQYGWDQVAKYRVRSPVPFPVGKRASRWLL